MNSVFLRYRGLTTLIVYAFSTILHINKLNATDLNSISSVGTIQTKKAEIKNYLPRLFLNKTIYSLILSNAGIASSTTKDSS
ncbi:MAG: hypothetical protein IKX01_01035, partial [Bacteroidales bacterium]|nr:hypothetical protein [Bacteroidales bacterium]